MPAKLTSVVLVAALAAPSCAGDSLRRPETQSGAATTGPTLEQLKAECDQGQRGACFVAAVRIGIGSAELRPDRRLSVFYASRACDLGDIDSCVGVAAARQTGSGVPRDRVQAFESFQTICDARNASACERLGDAYENGWGTDIDLDKAQMAYAKACKLDEHECIERPVANRPTADFRWRGGDLKACPIHKLPFEEDRVPIVYGLGSDRGVLLDREEGVPFANTYIPQGCIVTSTSPRAGLVRYCRQCRAAKDGLGRRVGETPSNSELQRTDYARR